MLVLSDLTVFPLQSTSDQCWAQVALGSFQRPFFDPMWHSLKRKTTSRTPHGKEKHMKQPQQITPVDAQTTFVEVWRRGQELERLHARIAPRFVRPEPPRRALAYLKGIVSAIERKNRSQLPQQAAHPPPHDLPPLL